MVIGPGLLNQVLTLQNGAAETALMQDLMQDAFGELCCLEPFIRTLVRSLIVHTMHFARDKKMP